MKRSFSAIVLLGLITLTACGSSSKSSNLDALIRDKVNVGLAPLKNGFGFANYGAASSPEQFNTDDLVTMFGAGACVGGTVDNCVPTAQSAAWARMVNDARQSGHCEGLVVQASARFNEKAEPVTAELPLESEVAHGVMRAFATQFLPEVQDAAGEWSKKSLVDIVNELTKSLKDGVTDYTMGLYTEDGGHAVLPFAVDFSSDTMAVVRVYDSNWPGMDRYVVIDFEKNEWFFSFSGRDAQQDECVWKGGPGDIDLTPLSARTSANCPFCGTKTTVTKSMLLIRSTTKNWSIKTSQGTYSPSSDIEVAGVNAKSIRSATCDTKTKLPEFIIGADSTDMEITLPDDSSAYVSSGQSVVEIKTTGKKKRQPITISGNTITVNDPDTTTTISNNNLAVVITAPQAEVSLSNNQISVVITTDSGEETVNVTPANPRQEIVVENNNNVVISDATQSTNSLAPVVPEVLKQDTQSVALPPAEERNLNNAQYVEEVKTSATSTTTTTSVAATKATTTTIATTSNPQSSAGIESTPSSTTGNSSSSSSTTTTSSTSAPSSALPSSSSSSTSSSTTSSTTTSTTTTTIPVNCSGMQLLSSDWGGSPPYSYMYLSKNSNAVQDECYPAQVTVRYYRDGARTNQYAGSAQQFTLTAYNRYDHVCPSGSSGLYVYWTATATRTAPFSFGTWSASPYGANSINC